VVRVEMGTGTERQKEALNRVRELETVCVALEKSLRVQVPNALFLDTPGSCITLSD